METFALVSMAESRNSSTLALEISYCGKTLRIPAFEEYRCLGYCDLQSGQKLYPYTVPLPLTSFAIVHYEVHAVDYIFV